MNPFVKNTAFVDRVIELALTIQQIAAPTFAEQRRAAFVLEGFRAAGLADVQTDAIGNVYGRLPGSANARPVVLSAHLDTVFPLDVPLQARRNEQSIQAPGIGDNSLGLAALFGVIWARQDQPPRGDLWLVANVGEEGLGDLRGMKAVVDRFNALPQAYLILEGLAFGQVYHRALGSKRYRITAETKGGHSWVDFGAPSAIHELAGLITRLVSLPLPHKPRTTLNVGVIAGGTSVNTIAAEARLELDLRSEGVETLSVLAANVEELVAAAARPEVKMSAEVIGLRPAGEIPADHPLVRMALHSLEAQGVSAHLSVGSTDANIPLSRGLPAVCIGLTTGGGAHTLHETIQFSMLERGLGQLLHLLDQVFASTP